VSGVRGYAHFAGLRARLCLGPSPWADLPALQSHFLLKLCRGRETVREPIMAELRRWAELESRDCAAKAFLKLRQFPSDFPKPRNEIAPASSNNGGRDPRSWVASAVKAVRVGALASSLLQSLAGPDHSGKFCRTTSSDRRSLRRLPANLMHGGSHERRAGLSRAWERGHEAPCGGVESGR